MNTEIKRNWKQDVLEWGRANNLNTVESWINDYKPDEFKRYSPDEILKAREFGGGVAWSKVYSARHIWINDFQKKKELQRVHIGTELIYKIIVPAELTCLVCASAEFWRMTFEPDIWRCSICNPIATAKRIVEKPVHNIKIPVEGACHICNRIRCPVHLSTK